MKNFYYYWCLKFGTWYNLYYGDKNNYIMITKVEGENDTDEIDE